MTTTYPRGIPAGVFAKLKALVEDSLERSRPLDGAACDALGVDFESAFSLRSQMLSRRVKRTSPSVRAACEGNLAPLWLAGGPGSDVVSLARKVKYPPYLFARLLVESVLGCSRAKVGELMKRPELIPDARLRAALQEALDADDDCSPASDQARRIVGTEYEALLQRRLTARGVPFQSEDELRRAGLSKTPDVKLGLPLGVFEPARADSGAGAGNDESRGGAGGGGGGDAGGEPASASASASSSSSSDGEPAPSAGGQWREVNWIDSKAMFGDKITWTNEHLTQLEGYVHRYGPGLVVYWFGFESAGIPLHPDIAVVSDFGGDALLFPGAEAPSFKTLTEVLEAAAAATPPQAPQAAAAASAAPAPLTSPPTSPHSSEVTSAVPAAVGVAGAGALGTAPDAAAPDCSGSTAAAPTTPTTLSAPRTATGSATDRPASHGLGGRGSPWLQQLQEQVDEEEEEEEAAGRKPATGLEHGPGRAQPRRLPPGALSVRGGSADVAHAATEARS